MPADRFIDLAVRLGAYQGVLAARYRLEEEEGEQEPVYTAPTPQTPSSDRRRVGSDPTHLKFDPVLSGAIEYGTAAA